MHHRQGTLASVLLATLSLAMVSDPAPPPDQMQVGTRYGNRVLVPSNQLLDPAGQRVEFGGRPVDMALSPDGSALAVLLPNGIQIFSPEGRKLHFIPAARASIAGISFTPDGQWVVASVIGADGSASVAIGDVKGVYGWELMKAPSNSTPTGLVFDATGANLYVALSRRNALGRLDISQGQVVGEVQVGVAPQSVAITPQGDRLFVANWGGRRPLSGERTARSSGTQTLVDERGVANSGSVSVIDVARFQTIAEIPVGLHPGSIRISPDGRLAAVANANSDSITFLDTASLQVVDTVHIPAWPVDQLGSSPTALAFGTDGEWLYVACGGLNAVAMLRRQESTYRLQGYVPTDWYPVAIAVLPSDAGDTIYVANSKGLGSRDAQSVFHVGRALGTLNVFPGGTLDFGWQQAVALGNNPFQNAVAPPDSPVDLGQLGVRHVFLIIKENRTYDQVLGDLNPGNGSPGLAIFGQEVTPNHHLLARQFVTLDNFYASGVLSADGHQWMTQAMATDYLERSHSTYPRSYPYSGEDPLAFAASGFLWNRALEAGLTVRVFGEFTLPAEGFSPSWSEFYRDTLSSQTKLAVRSFAPVAPVNALIEPSFPGFAMNIPDAYRSRLFLEKFRAFEQQGNLPNLVILWLPADHTAGTSPGFPTPRAMVADNDLAVGVIVEAITKSPDWPRSAIFIVEDDAQGGVDHVDGHRTVCLVISPYTRRGAVDSTHYNQTSVLRTIEELLGLAPMNKFDATALPMRSAFVTKADLQAFTSAPNRIPLDEMNPSLASLRGPQRQAALDSMGMDFSRPDAAPEQRLNRILWHAIRGWNDAYPHVPHRASCILDEDDR